MGVKGLWNVLKPACEPLPSQERLKNHRIAVDASIWMYQLTKALPANESTMLSGGGYNPLVLTGLVRRVCKLLHFGIKPVFVFDGGVPVLKAATVKERRSRRAEAESRYKRLAKKMLKIRMSLVAIGGNEAVPNAAENKEIIHEMKGQEEVYESSESEVEDFDRDLLDNLNIESEEFKSLPLDLKQELLMALKERVFSEQLGKTALITDSLDFSKNQIDALVKRRRIAGELERVSKSGFGSYNVGKEKESHQIAASSTREFVLVKNEITGGWLFTDKDKTNEPEYTDKRDPGAIVNEDDEFEKDFFAEDDSIEPSKVTPTIVPTCVPEITNTVNKVIEMPVAVVSAEFENKFKPPKDPIADGFTDEYEQELLPSLTDIQKGHYNIKVKTEALLKALHEEQTPLTKDLSVTVAEPIRKEVPNQDEEFYLQQDDEDDFLEEFQFTTREDLLNRLDSSLIEAQERMKSAQNESGMLGNELLADFQHLLSLFGLPWMVAPMEAEAQCAWLQSAGLVDGIITDDSDVLVFAPAGSPLLVYRHFFKDRSPVLVYGMPRIQLQMGLDRRDLVILAFLLGGDYGVGVRGIGAKRGLELLNLLKKAESLKSVSEEAEYCLCVLRMIKRLVHDFDSIGAELELSDQKALEKLIKVIHHIDDGFPSQAILEAYLEPAVSQDTRPFVWQTPNALMLEKFLHGRCGWSPAQFRNVVGPILRRIQNK